ncbi:hypothetical protein EJ04DRAFT_127708 [Polyplosphaeria fusca]|uniref:Uncharacterized protein n=1 Tax=Polyplosphaeria fusca TaxID=682080 RepID=A0A9P4QN70_9PLEO|nr:hypothetical protein EJ04DRAFT_127708 [Polyplosphaeria fusca]
MPPVIRTEPLNANGHANADDDDDPGAVAFPAADVHDRRPTPEPNPQPLQVAIPGRRPRSPSPWRTPTPPSHPSRPLHQPRIPWGDVKHDLAHPPKGSHDPRTKAEKRLLGDYGKPRNGIAFPSPEHQSMNWMDEVEVIRGKHVQPKVCALGIEPGAHWTDFSHSPAQAVASDRGI